MHRIMDTEEFARLWFKVPDDGAPTKSQLDTVGAMCRDGRIRNARKMCSKWFIDCTAEWPEMFPDELPREKEVVYVERAPRITADMRLGDALAVLLDALAQGKESAA